MHPEDASYKKILYRVNLNEPVKTHKSNRVTYSTPCASYLSIRAMHQIAKDEGAAHPLAASDVTQDFYVDDLLTGSNS